MGETGDGDQWDGGQMYLGKKITEKNHKINMKRTKEIDRKNLLKKGTKGLRPLDQSVVNEESDELRESIVIEEII